MIFMGKRGAEQRDWPSQGRVTGADVGACRPQPGRDPARGAGAWRVRGTKSGKRREVPMRQVVYDLLAALPEPRTGRIWRQRNIRTAFESASRPPAWRTYT